MLPTLRTLISTATLAVIGLPFTAYATEYDWTGNGGNVSWNNAGNWLNSVKPISAVDTVIKFPGGGTSTQDIASPIKLGELLFGVSTVTTISGSTLDFRAGNGNSAGLIIDQSNQPLTLNNPIQNNVGLTVLSATGVGDLNFNGPIAGSGGVTLQRNGVVKLSGNNIYAGGTEIISGTLRMGASSTLPAGDVTVDAAGKLDLSTFGNGSSTVPNKALHQLTINGGTVRAPSGNADFWMDSLSMTGGTVDLTDTNNFWLHFTGASTGITSVASSNVSRIIGDTSDTLRNNSNLVQAITVADGLTPSGIDLDIDLPLIGTVDVGFTKFGPGVLRLTRAGSTADLRVAAGTLRVDELNAIPTGVLKVDGGTIDFATAGANVVALPKLTTGASGATFTVSDPAANVTLSSGISGTTPICKKGPGKLTLPGFFNRDAVVVSEGTLALLPNSPTSTGKGVSIGGMSGNWLATLDLTNNSMVYNYNAGSNPVPTLIDTIASGYNGGAWNGKGTITSMGDDKHALGVAEASDVFSVFPAMFQGVQVDDTAGLVRFTLRGDANLDGKVDFADLLKLAQHYGQSGYWSAGDFNYDNTVNFADLLVLAQNYGQQLTGQESCGGEWATVKTPEPSLAATAALLTTISLRRQRRGGGRGPASGTP